ncbi:hypothetical protein [Burkholderia ubonensis]|uniref:MarR family transcriptional regulator n=1 Tax=Burkholderia ubonensis TaxID=101571 RepID=A0ABD4E9S4_9BURK|nr:hypothetical protein [Burkholderia ubonensis]KVN92579.1 hypothetical protein WJ68_33710 [Burkholderia ubonensis]
MRNIPVSRSRQPETVAPQDLIDAMRPGQGYTQDEVCDLLQDRPRTAVRDTLNALVNKGLVWRDASGSRVRFSVLAGDELRASIERKAIPEQSSFGAPLRGYDAEIQRFRDLCMIARF